MTERRGDQGFSVTPRRIDETGPGGSWRRRRRGIGLVAVVVSAGALVVLAGLGPRLTQRPSFDVSFFATPTPIDAGSPAPLPSEAEPDPGEPTPLPAVTRPDGPVPSGRIAVETPTLRLIDLASGDVATGPPLLPGRDAIVRTPGDDGWTCVCFDDDNPVGRILRLDTIAADGHVHDSTALATFPRAVSDTGAPAVLTDVDLVAGGHRGLLAVADRTGGPWRIRVAPIDVDARTLGAMVELGAIGPAAFATPSPGPDGGADLALDGPHVRLSPDGRVGFVWGVTEVVSGEASSTSEIHAWRIPLGADGSAGTVTVARGLLGLPRFCGTLGFAAADRFAWVCPRLPADQTTGYDGTWEVGTVDLDGNPAGRNEIAADPNSYLDGVFDVANGQAFTWDPIGLTASRFDIHTLVRSSITYDPLVQASSGLAPGGGESAPAWRQADSTAGGFGSRIVGSSDGTRLIALGFQDQSSAGSGMPASRGMFVIDRRTLALLDRWDPVADYVTLASLPGGVIAAAGLPGVTDEGRSAPWEASLTIHAATDGRVLVRFGRLGMDALPIVVSR